MASLDQQVNIIKRENHSNTAARPRGRAAVLSGFLVIFINVTLISLTSKFLDNLLEVV